jgi:hypothetical protein
MIMVLKEDTIPALTLNQTLVHIDGTLVSYHEFQAYAVAKCVSFLSVQ